jgi:hypothetical protein
MPYYRRHLDDRQVHRRWVDPRIHAVRIADIRTYLLRKDWKEVPPDQPGVLVFEEPVVSEDGPLYQWIPDSEQRREYFQSVYELLAALAEIEDRYAGDVLTDVLEHSDARALSANGPQASTQTDAVQK